ncbi:CaiF/GrlA family transcriptional regulator [Serratia quinivorans]|uniref:CaiF/GrlA family transcriptional regulator n=1 Tax=Serratia quinivorans TaxID=137545 RepID=UPI00217A35AB|nr:CaiF/GrlA family transcriptional regulator [Serratia quinivorans]CAI1113067.1 Protein of uncharacterised function (DUF1401) [Serratia quinivorans]CAI1874939.1 Protein of uncharacterised function (DUF1401) [Serratia quinivorans]
MTLREKNYRLPDEVAHLAGEPLTRIIASWGLSLQSYLDKARVAKGFGLPPRQAANVLRYVTRSPCVECECRLHTNPTTHRQELRVWVKSVSKPSAFHSAPKPNGKKQLDAIWAQLIHRPWNKLNL